MANRSLNSVRPFSLDDFMRESNRIEGIHRDPTKREIEATARFLSCTQAVTITDLIALVAVYQPNARPRFSQGLDVYVGQYQAPRGGPHIQQSLQLLLDAASPRSADPYLIHVAYEKLHPFTDGNGRSGRALWLWCMGGMWKAPLGFLHHFYYQTLQHS